MKKQTNGYQFREDDIVIMSHYDKKTGEYVTTVYPKIGGRLRLAHEENDSISINTEIVRSDDSIAVVRAVVTTGKGSFSGIGMASIERDERIAPAILELAETRAIARALRFSGFGVEYCSAEEVSHLNGNVQDVLPGSSETPQEPESAGVVNDDKAPDTKAPNKGNGDSRVTNKQLNYIINLGRNFEMDSKALDKESLNVFGVKLAYLTKRDASSFIENLKEKAA